MLFLVFQLGQDQYALDVTQVVEVLPLVNVKLLPAAPAGVVGIFDYHGEPLPLVDLAELILGRASRRWMSTRIIVVKGAGDPDVPGMLGLLIEQVQETVVRKPEDFRNATVSIREAQYLGPVTTHAGRILQQINIPQLLSETVRGLLFSGRAV